MKCYIEPSIVFPSFTRMFQVMSNKPMFWDPVSLSELCSMLLQFHSLLFCGLNKDVGALTLLAIPSFFHILYPRVVDASQHFLAPTVRGLTRLTNPASQVTHLTIVVIQQDWIIDPEAIHDSLQSHSPSPSTYHK